MKEVFFKQCTEENKRRGSAEKRRNMIGEKMMIRKKVAIMAVLILLMSFGVNVQAYAANNEAKVMVEVRDADAYAYKQMDRISAGSAYPSMQGLALGDGNAYVLKYGTQLNKKNTIDEYCILFSGKETNLKQEKKKLELGHGNDMTYRTQDGKLYVAPMNQKYIIRMTTKGIVESKIKTSFPVGSVACWQDYDKAHHKDAFVLKSHEDGSFHVVEVNGTTVKEICKFEAVGGRANQGICVYKGYLYITEWNNKSGNSYVYRVSKKLSAIVKEKDKEERVILSADRIVTLDKRDLLQAAGVSGKDVKLEIESIDFLDGYLYFTANANYKDATKAHKQHSLDGLYKVKKRLA